MLWMEDSLLLKIKKHEKYQICIMGFVRHQGITLILMGGSAIKLICVYDVYLGVPLLFNSLKSPLLKKCLNG